MVYHPHRRRLLLLPLLVAATAAASEVCHETDPASAYPGCVDASGLARRHGDVWRERAGRRAGGGCVRRVSACVAGRLLRPVPDRVERCPRAQANYACRMESFFTCCPVYDCPSKLASLIAPMSPGQDSGTPAVETFLSRVEVPELFEADALPLPVAQPQLNAASIRQLLGWLAGRPTPPSPSERAVRSELRRILTVLETAGPPPEPAEASGALSLLRQLAAPRRKTVVTLLRLLLDRVDSGQAQRPLTAQLLLRSLMDLAKSTQVDAKDVAVVATALVRLQLDSRETPIEELLRYIVLYGALNTVGTETESPEPEPEGRMGTEPIDTDQACSEEYEGLVWAEMEVPVDGRCTRHVRGCRGGRVVTTAELQDRPHVCDASGPELCRLQSFFTCCPVFDCGEKLQTLRAQDPLFLGRDSLTPEQFLQRVSKAELDSVTAPVPIVDRSLDIQVIITMRAMLGNSSAQERLLGQEMDQIIGLFESDVRPAAPAAAVEILAPLAPTMDDIGVSVMQRGTAVRPATVLSALLAVQRLAELRDALTSGALPESVVPAELPGAAARLLLVLTSMDQTEPLQSNLHQLVLSVAGGRPVAGPQLAALLTGLSRVLDAWIDLLPPTAFALTPESGPLGADSPPTSLTALLWRLLTAGDGPQPAPLVPPAIDRVREDGALLEAVLKLVERLQRVGEPLGRLRPALVRLVRQLARPDGADSPKAVRLLLGLVRRLGSSPAGLQPDVLQAMVDLLGRLGGHRRPTAAPSVLQLLVQLVEGLTPQHRVAGQDTHAMIVELLQLLSSRPDSVTPAGLQLLVTVVRQLGERTRQDVRPVMLAKLMTLLAQLGDSTAAPDSRVIRLVVRLVGRLGEVQPNTGNAAVQRLLLQVLETLTAAPDGAPADSIQLTVRLVDHLGRPDTDTAGPEVTNMILQLIEGLQRRQQTPSPQLGRQLVQLVVQLARRHDPAAAPLKQLMLALLPLLSAQGPRSEAPDSLLKMLLAMVERVTEGRKAQDSRSELHQLLLQLTEQLNAERRPLTPNVRRLLLELFIGTQTGGVSETDVMSFVLSMLELMSQKPSTPTTTVSFNISTPAVDEPDSDVRDLRRLIELLITQRQLGGRAASPTDTTGVITLLLGDGGSDSSDTEQLLRLLLRLLESERSTSGVPDLFNITAVFTEDGQKDFSDILRLMEIAIARMNSSRSQTSSSFNITGIIVDEDNNDLEDMQNLVEVLLARLSSMADEPSKSGFFNISLISETPNQVDKKFRDLLEMMLLEMKTMESGTQPTRVLNISTILVDGNREDYTEVQQLLTMMLAQMAARAETPRTPGFINISLVQEDGGEFQSMRYLLEQIMSSIRSESVSQSQPGSLNISGVLVSPDRRDFGDISDLLKLIHAQISASQAPSDFPGFFNISGILVNAEQTEIQSLRTMLEMVMSRMSAENDVPTNELSAFRELIVRFFNRPSSGPQNIDVQGIVNMVIDLGERDTEPTFSIGDFIALIQSLNVSEDHPTFTDDIQRLVILLRKGSKSPSFLSDLTEVVVRLLQLVEASDRSTNVSPEMLIRFIVRQLTQSASDGPNGLDELLTALVGLIDGRARPRRPTLTFGVVLPPPDSLPASLRNLALQLQLAARQARPLLHSLPQLLRLLTALASPGRGAPDSLRFAAQLATAVLERAPDAVDRVLVPQILLQLRQLNKQPQPAQLAIVTGLLRRLLLLEQQRRPTDPGTDGEEVTVAVISSVNNTNTELVTLLRGLLDGRTSAGGASPLPELTQGLLDVLLRTERAGGEVRLADLLPQLVAVLRLTLEPPADAGPLTDNMLKYVTELTRAVLERLDPRADPLLPRVLLLLRWLEPRPQPDAVRGVLDVLEQLLAQQEGGRTAVGGGDVPKDLLDLVLRLEEVSESGRPSDYLPLVVTLLRRTERKPKQIDPALMTYLTELVRALLRRDAFHLDPLLAPHILALIGNKGSGAEPAPITELLPVLELLVGLQTETNSDTGFGSLNDLFELLTPSGRTTGGGGGDFSTFLTELLGPGRLRDAPEVSQSLLSHLVHLLRLRPDTRPDHDVNFVSPEEAARLLLLLTGRLDDPAAVPIPVLDSLLSLLDPGHVLQPTDTTHDLLRSVLLRVWGATGRPGSADPAALYRRLLALLTDRPAEMPASEAGLRHALLLLLAGPSAAQQTTETVEAAQLLLTLLTRPDGGDPQLVPAGALRLLASLLEAATDGGREVAVPEPALRHLVRLLIEPERRRLQPAPEELVRLLVTVVTNTPDRGRYSVHRVALRLLLRLLGGDGAHRMIPIREDSLRALLTLPNSRSGADPDRDSDSDSDSEDALLVLSLLSEPSHGVLGLSDGPLAAVLGGSDSDHGDPGERQGQHDPPAVSAGVYRLLTLMMAGQPDDGADGDPSQPPRSRLLRLLSLFGEHGLDLNRVPSSVQKVLKELVAADPSGGSRQLPGSQRLLRRLMMMMARDRGLTPPGRRRCRLLCDAAGAPDGQRSTSVQLVPGNTPITFIGENHVLVMNGPSRPHAGEGSKRKMDGRN